MSLKQEERDIMVALEMEKADSTFAEHEGLTKNLANFRIISYICTVKAI